jgi:hypothetical protein
MRLLAALCILLLVSFSSQAEEIMFFADDHYKSLGRPHLVASAANPALQPGEGLLRIDIANLGELEELLPINQSGRSDDIILEMKEEMKGANAKEINAALLGSGPIIVTTAPQIIRNLLAGEKESIDFNVSVMKNSSGWHELVLDLTYLRQADVSVRSGVVYPLDEAERQNITIDVFVSGNGEPLRVLAARSRLYPGEGDVLKAAIGNDGESELHNCSARLLAAPPFQVETLQAALGDLSPGSIVVADFLIDVDGSARPQDYQMECEVCCREKCTSIPLTVSLQQPGALRRWSLPAIVFLVLAGIAAILLRRGSLGDLLRRSRRRWRP